MGSTQQGGGEGRVGVGIGGTDGARSLSLTAGRAGSEQMITFVWSRS